MVMQVIKYIESIVNGLNFMAPIGDLILRFWVAYVFWIAGYVKWMNMEATSWLFTYEYQVPFLSPQVAAYLGTGIELLFPVLLALGLCGRFSALVLFIYNIIAASSYPGLTQVGMDCHVVWGIMLLIVILRGPGKLSVDYFLWKKVSRTSK